MRGIVYVPRKMVFPGEFVAGCSFIAFVQLTTRACFARHHFSKEVEGRGLCAGAHGPEHKNTKKSGEEAKKLEMLPAPTHPKQPL